MPEYTTLPGDLAALDSQGMGEGMPIWRRFAVIIRSRRIDITEVMRGYDNVDRGFFQQGQFRRALCDCMGNQWTELAMTTPEFELLASPYYGPISGISRRISSHRTSRYSSKTSVSVLRARRSTTPNEEMKE